MGNKKMKKASEDFLTTDFDNKLKEVRRLEAQKHHQNDMYNKPLQNKRKDAVYTVLKNNVPEQKFLEVGCAEGLFCHKAMVFGALAATGVDVVAEKIEVAKRQYPNCEFIVGDVQQLSTSMNCGIILCSEVLQHLVDYAKCLRNMAKILSNQGLLVITTPNLSGSTEHEFADIRHDADADELLSEIGGASFGKQNAIWKFNTKTLAEEIENEFSLELLDFIKIGAEPFPHQTAEQAANLFTVMLFRKKG
jgi:2-polyprenyl-3-methyl-5-hydroxy-6-metoxy-1,4-benzoquinol methylase